MSVTFANAPLVEIIAELRWVPPQQMEIPSQQQPIAFQIPFFGGSKQDEFFMRLGAKLHQQGFQAVERLMPPGFMTLVYQPIYRYKMAAEPSPVIYQAGAGLFSAHGIPPYRSWEEFVPFVKNGVTALLESRDSKEKDIPLATVSLRYIDAFRRELTQGKSGPAFMADVLGIAIELPDILRNFGKSASEPQYALHLTIPISDDTVLNMNIAEGQVHGSDAIIMDTQVACNRGVPPDITEVMEVLQTAHDVVHAMFVKLTAPIHELMQPSEGISK
jgi:uncharacterized protein (TIGR04255 family)